MTTNCTTLVTYINYYQQLNQQTVAKTQQKQHQDIKNVQANTCPKRMQGQEDQKLHITCEQNNEKMRSKA